MDQNSSSSRTGSPHSQSSMWSYTFNILLMGVSYGLAMAALVIYFKYFKADIDNASTSILKTHEIEAQLEPWYFLCRPKSKSMLPLGPSITARLADKLCGINKVQLSRLPHGQIGTTNWSTLTSIIIYLLYLDMLLLKYHQKPKITISKHKAPLGHTCLLNH